MTNAVGSKFQSHTQAPNGNNSGTRKNDSERTIGLPSPSRLNSPNPTRSVMTRPYCLKRLRSSVRANKTRPAVATA